MALIKSIEHLRMYVNVMASKDFTTYETFLNDAQDKYLEYYFGDELLSDISDKGGDKLNQLLCRALGPFSLALSTDEMSINFGESGHTVTRTDKLAPASDAKIEKSRESLLQRAWANLDKAIEYVSEKENDYSLWKKSKYYRLRQTFFFDSATDFEENGLVTIDRSPLTFFRLRGLIQRVEQTEVIPLFPDTLKNDRQGIDAYPQLQKAVKMYTASRTAALHTAQTTHRERNKRNETEFEPILRPLFDDTYNSGNYYREQAEYWYSEIEKELQGNDLSEKYTGMRWNDSDKRTFVADAKRMSDDDN